ncbi:hypothetical protein D3Z50_20485, partial [Clostridiaceae bacterium]|nr:hypothetical protein [Clostridiaceae bacterium]
QTQANHFHNVLCLSVAKGMDIMMKDFSILQESLFTGRGSAVEMFTDLTVRMGISEVTDTININAVT